jgi:hypothetical protein
MQKSKQVRNQRKGSARKSRVETRSGTPAMEMVHRPPVVRFTPNVFGFPDRLLTKVRYCDILSITSTGGGQGKYLWRWNSTFDPDYTGTGHQPLYRDTYAAIYDQYAVVAATATFEILNTTVSPLVVIMNTDDDGSISTNNNVLEEQSHGQSKLMTPLTGSSSKVTMTASWSAAEFLNIDPFSSQTYKTPVGSNATEESLLSLSVFTTDVSTASINIKLTLVQEVLWTELATPTIS